MSEQPFRMGGAVRLNAETLLQRMTDGDELCLFAKHMGASTAEAKIANSGIHEEMKIELYMEEPSRMGTGMDKATLVLVWNIQEKTCTWERIDHVHGDRARVRGRMWIIPKGARSCELYEEGIVDVKIPLIGSMIGRKIVAALEKHHPEKREYWEKSKKSKKR